MGCFNETCAVSGTPIREGQQVKMVVFKFPTGTLPPPHNFFDRPELVYHSFVGTFTGKYDDYGRIDNVNAPQNLNDINLQEKREAIESKKYYWFFVHQAVWDEVENFIKVLEEDEDNFHYGYSLKSFKFMVNAHIDIELDQQVFPVRPEIENDLYEMLRIHLFMLQTRKYVWAGDYFRGSQTIAINEQKLIAQQILKWAQIIENEED